MHILLFVFLLLVFLGGGWELNFCFLLFCFCCPHSDHRHPLSLTLPCRAVSESCERVKGGRAAASKAGGGWLPLGQALRLRLKVTISPQKCDRRVRWKLYSHSPLPRGEVAKDLSFLARTQLVSDSHFWIERSSLSGCIYSLFLHSLLAPPHIVFYLFFVKSVHNMTNREHVYNKDIHNIKWNHLHTF